jgi:lipoprotein-anchoring transpeptidase ErfK/SrfK
MALDAIEIRLVASGSSAPGSTELPFIQINLFAQAYVTGRNWQTTASGNGLIIGITDQSVKLEAIRIWQSGSTITGGVEYSSYLSGTGWTSWAADQDTSGTIGQGRQIEALRIRLTGDLANRFDIYYRVNIADYGWLGWAKNGANAGTATCDLAVRAIQIIYVLKGAAAPGSTSNAYWTSPPISLVQQAMNARAQTMSSPTPWLIVIDTSNCVLGVYYGSRGNWTCVQYWSCATGKPSTPTIKGVFSVGARGYVFGPDYSCYWYVQIYGDYLIHSIKYYKGTFNVMDGSLGVQVSQGCVRLDINNAKWIYDNIPRQTTVLIY